MKYPKIALAIIFFSSSLTFASTKDIQFSILIDQGSLHVDTVDENGIIVPNPHVYFEPIKSTINDQIAKGVLGIEKEKIRLSNPTMNPSWSVSIAPTDGESAMWKSPSGETIDHNDPHHSAGVLIIDPSTATVQNPLSGNIEGISLGERFAFTEGKTQSITLYTANSSAEIFSQYDITNITIEQLMPGGKPPGKYTLNLTITAL